MKKLGESCDAQTVAGKEATRTGANALGMHERGPQELTQPAAEMGGADPPTLFFSGPPITLH